MINTLPKLFLDPKTNELTIKTLFGVGTPDQAWHVLTFNPEQSKSLLRDAASIHRELKDTST